MPSNELYLAVMPLVHITPNQFLGYGLTEQILTLFSDKSLATHFFPDEVDTYISLFRSRAEKYLTGGHVKEWQFSKLQSLDGRVIVKVMQIVE